MTTTKPAGKKPAARSRRTAVPEAATSPGSPALDVLTGAGPARPAGAGVAHLELAPSDLVVEANVRTDLALDDAFVESIREHGVRIPIAARRDPLGQWLVVDGHRRHAAALKVGLASVPVFELDGIGDEETRIVTQYVSNEHRTGLSAADRAKTINDMALFGRTPKTIVRRLGVTVAEVEAAGALAGKTTTTAALEQAPGITLEQAALIAEFDDDALLVEELTALAVEAPGRLAHQVEKERRERAALAAEAAQIAELEAAGVTVLDKLPGWQDKEIAELDELVDDPTKTSYKDVLDAAGHASCPGHAAFVDGYVDHAGVAKASVRYYCTDWKSNGHFNRHAANTSGATSGPKTEEEKAAAREIRENNKSAEVATVVRRRFITEDLMQRKKLPANTLSAVAIILEVGARQNFHTNVYTARGLTREFRGVEGEQPLFDVFLDAGVMAEKYLLSHAAGLAEALMREKDYWRGNVTAVAAWLQYLGDAGYTLTEVEAGYAKKNLPKKGAKR